MHALKQLFTEASSAQAIMLLALVAVLGLALGTVRVRGIALGVAGVLFTGLLAGKLLSIEGVHVDASHLELARELGLILFVYTVGVQVGPGFVGSLRRQGLPLNLLAGGVVVLGFLVTVLVHKVGGVDLGIAAGLFSGGTTNTPSLAAAQQAIKDSATAGLQPPAIGYAIAYPFGVIGIIIAMLILRWFAKIDVETERAELARELEANNVLLHTANIEVCNQNLAGLELHDVPTLAASGVVVSRLRRGEATSLATGDTRLQLGDVLLAVGPKQALHDLKLVVGGDAQVDLRKQSSGIVTQTVIATNRPVLGRTIKELDVRERFGVTVTRVLRAEIEMPPKDVRLQFGDRLLMVGEPAAIAFCADLLGNSVKRLNHPQVVAVFFGMMLGILLGSIPFSIPGIPVPVKLGLAGGPLLVAIVLSRLGHVGPMVLYLPTGANLILRELGICLFLAAVGLKAGEAFFANAFTFGGLYWLGCGAAITLLPLVIVAAIGRFFMGQNYLSLCGMLAGSMTDPPALQFATRFTQSDAPNVSYATVYPLVMLLRVVGAQVLILTMA